ncbi:hypothetical protein [Arcticibacter sp.]|uniref:hypothetical protein n=1 Tax=Arcticibacter sp. TaxID=1872630 RepID=UPI00388D9186
MSHTVIGIFNSSSQAQDAVEYLTANGFDRGNLDIRTSQAGSLAIPESAEVEVSDPIGDFFSSIFGPGVSDAARYTEAGRNGTIVTVHAINREQADVAARILDSHGAADVDEHADEGTGVADGSRLRSRIVEGTVEDSLRLRQENSGENRGAAHRPHVDVDAFNKGAL